MQVLTKDGRTGAAKGWLPRDPFIDHHAQGILITGGTGFALDLFGSYVERGPGGTLSGEGVERRLHHGNAKVREEHFVLRGEEDILWFDVTVPRNNKWPYY